MQLGGGRNEVSGCIGFSYCLVLKHGTDKTINIMTSLQTDAVADTAYPSILPARLPGKGPLSKPFCIL